MHEHTHLPVVSSSGSFKDSVSEQLKKFRAVLNFWLESLQWKAGICPGHIHFAVPWPHLNVCPEKLKVFSPDL